ncbi:MAG: hypothetical protein QM679_00030 [Patulibacter sp.]
MVSRSFTDLVTSGEPDLAPLLLAFSEEIGRSMATPDDERAIRSDRLREWIARRAAALAALGERSPSAQLAALHRHVCLGLDTAAARPLDTRLRDLRPDYVCRSGAGHPAVATALVAAAAQEAGRPVDVIVSPSTETMLLAVRDHPEAGAIEYGAGVLMPARELGDRLDLRWVCAHEVAAILLELVALRAAELGLHPAHVAARAMGTKLPLEFTARQRLDVQLARARSAYN